jgi:hypothetical protein
VSGLYTVDDIYRLLPELHRIRDEERGGVLRELVSVITDQVNELAESLDEAYDDQFIETCAEWVAPYIGDLIGYRTLHGVVPRVASPRAEVANTIGYRRRKGTASMLEQLARDVTGWPARAVEMFERLVTTQYMNHVRLHAAATANLRDATRLALDPAFDDFAHTAEMRRIASGGGRYDIPNVAIFLWRIAALRLARSPLVGDGSGLRFRFDPLGTDLPLFGAPRTERDMAHLAEPLDVPLALGRRFADAHLADLYGAGRSLLLETAAGPIAVADVRICDLSDVTGGWNHAPQPGATHVAVDPVLGRVAFPAAPVEPVATFHYGSALATGGGGYDRGAEPPSGTVTTGGGSLGGALTGVAAGGTVTIADSDRYVAPATLTATGDVTLRSANRERPLVSRSGQFKVALGPQTTVTLDGLLLAGAPLVIEESADSATRTLVLRHCTLVPTSGVASLIVLHAFAEVVLDHCVTGPIVAVEGTELRAAHSVVDAIHEGAIALCGRAGGGTVNNAADRAPGDGLAAGGHLTLDSCTVVGKVHAERLDVSDSLLLAHLDGGADPWPAPVWAERRQVGCMRFSALPERSRTPRRVRCTTDVPHHSSLRYGDPAYGQLRRATPASIRTGSSDEGEMGVTHELHQPQRETNLLLRLDEYLRYGLQAGFFYAT